MKLTTKDVVDFLKDDVGSWERAACFCEQMSVSPADVSAEKEALWSLQGTIYRERSTLCKSLLADLVADGKPPSV